MPFKISEAAIQQVTDNVALETAARFQTEVTPEARAELEQQVRQALEVQATRFIGDTTTEAARRAVAADQDVVIGQRLSEQLKAGLGIVNLISEDAKYAEIVRKNANMQKIKYDAFVEAGFTTEQAFRLLEAEVMGKASARAHR